MKKLSLTLEKGLLSNYQIIITCPTTQQEYYYQQALHEFAKTYKKDGFRPGKVPLDMVKKEINPVYLDMDVINDIINQSINQVLDEHKEIKFIGEPYGLERDKKEDTLILRYKLDVYPEVEIGNDNWKSVSIEKIDTGVSDQEVEDALIGLKKQYATYVDSDVVTHHTTERLKVIYMNNNGEELFTKTLFIEHEDKHNGGFHNLEGKKTGDVIQLPYNQTVPSKLLYTKDDQLPETITLEVLRIQKQELPEFTDESVKSMFGNDGISSINELNTRIREVIAEQKYSNALIEHINTYITTIQGSFKVVVPQSMIEKDYKSRYEAMSKRFGNKEQFEHAYLQLPNGKEELEKKQEELREISKNSLIKFFLINKICELLSIEGIDRNIDMDAEKKLYHHFQPSTEKTN